MKMVAISFAIIFQVISHTLYGQTGGQSSFLFLNLSPSARNTALGSYAISWPGSDPTSAYLNPSLLNDKMNTAISFNHQFYFDGIDAGHVSYSQLIKKWNINFFYLCVVNSFSIATGYILINLILKTYSQKLQMALL